MKNLTNQAIEIMNSLLSLSDESFSKKLHEHIASDFGSMLEHAGFFELGLQIQENWYSNIIISDDISLKYAVTGNHTSEFLNASLNVLTSGLASSKLFQIESSPEASISSASMFYLTQSILPQDAGTFFTKAMYSQISNTPISYGSGVVGYLNCTPTLGVTASISINVEDDSCPKAA